MRLKMDQCQLICLPTEIDRWHLSPKYAQTNVQLFITTANDYNTMLHFVCHHYWTVVLAILRFRHDVFFSRALIAMRSL